MSFEKAPRLPRGAFLLSSRYFNMLTKIPSSACKGTPSRKVPLHGPIVQTFACYGVIYIFNAWASRSHRLDRQPSDGLLSIAIWRGEGVLKSLQPVTSASKFVVLRPKITSSALSFLQTLHATPLHNAAVTAHSRRGFVMGQLSGLC
jgi:hypothetical protein